jgi:uncharacterized protein (TIGR03084 family)
VADGDRPPSVPDVVDALDAQQQELDALLADRPPAGWAAPSRCAGWSVQDVVLHLAQTDEMAVGSVAGDLTGVLARLADGVEPAGGVDEGADALVRSGRGAPPAEVLDRWRAAAAAQVQSFRRCDPHARVDWVAGDLAAATLATTRLAETWIHTVDVAAADGARPAATARLWHVARLAWRTLPHAFAREGRAGPGPVAFLLDGPDGSAWHFGAADPVPPTVVSGPAEDLCEVAARRVEPSRTALVATGPDADAVLELVRTWA